MGSEVSGDDEGEFVDFTNIGDKLGDTVGFDVTGDRLVGDTVGFDVTGELLVGNLVGSLVARFTSVHTFPVMPLRHFVSPIPLPSPSTTIYSVVSTVPVQFRQRMGEYGDALLLADDKILPAQAFVFELVT